jgi:hypothetical protein
MYVPLLQLTSSKINIIDKDNSGYFKFSGDKCPTYEFNDNYDLIHTSSTLFTYIKPYDTAKLIESFIEGNIRKAFVISDIIIPIIFFKCNFRDIFNIFIQLCLIKNTTNIFESIFTYNEFNMFIGLSYKFNLFNLAFNTNTFFKLLSLFIKYIDILDYTSLECDLKHIYNYEPILINLYDLNTYYDYTKSIQSTKLCKKLKSYEEFKDMSKYDDVIKKLKKQFIFILDILKILHEYDKEYYLIFLISIY